MNLLRLREALRNVSGVIGAAGDKKAADDIRTLERAIPGDDNSSAETAIGGIEDLLKDRSAERIAEIVARLNAAGTDRVAFDQILGELKKDRSVGKEQADAIAHAYTSGRTKWPSKTAALAAIQARFNERAYEAAKMKIVEKAKVW